MSSQSYAYMDKKQVIEDCESILKKIENCRKEAFEKLVLKKMEERRFPFFGKLYTREEAEELIRKDFTVNPFHNFWSLEYKINKLLKLCDVSTESTIIISTDYAEILSSWRVL